MEARKNVGIRIIKHKVTSSVRIVRVCVNSEIIVNYFVIDERSGARGGDMSKRFRGTETTRQNSIEGVLEVRGLIRVIIDNSAHTHDRQLALIQLALISSFEPQHRNFSTSIKFARGINAVR